MFDTTTIGVADFKSYFARDFRYVPTQVGCPAEGVMDSDIEKALSEASQQINVSLFCQDSIAQTAYLYLSAHCLVENIQMSAQGLDSVSSWTANNRSVGSVSEGYQVPDWVSKDPYLSGFASTRYGQRYLQIIRPLLVGNVAVIDGMTTP